MNARAMKTFLITEARKWAVVVCLFFPPFCRAEQFVEIRTEIETSGYRLHDTNSIATAKPKTTTVVCITGAGGWYITNDYHASEQWLFDGKRVWCRTEVPNATGDQKFTIRDWESRDGHPMGHFGVNIPWL